MNKLLHERLRDYGENKTTITLVEDYEGSDLMYQVFAKWSDEIERYYIPRPRFEDGEPVQFGDKALRWDGKHGNDGENVVSITIEGGDYLRYGFNGDICSSEPFKRPQPKVLDADGVEIKVGETVWWADNDSAKYTVLRICSSKDCIVAENKDGGEFHLMGYFLTHKEPDSLIKLRDDMDEQAKNGGDEGVLANVDEWVDRLSALIDRSA